MILLFFEASTAQSDIFTQQEFLFRQVSFEEYPTISIGDTLQFWSVAYIDWQPRPLPRQYLIKAVCVTVGVHCYIFIDTALASAPDSSVIEETAAQFDTLFVPGLTDVYGPVPDEFDNDPRVFLLIVRPTPYWGGYFDPVHQMADAMVHELWGRHSNESEIIYVIPDFLPDVTLHELGHMLLWGQDHSPEPPENPVTYWEEGWIDEAFATFTTPLILEGLSREGVWDRNTYFATEPDRPLIHFLGGADYNKVKLWSTFMYEHYGGSDFYSILAADQANGIAGVRNTLQALGFQESFEETFEQWVLANYLDDPTYQAGKYSYYHYDFPSCALSADHCLYPVNLAEGGVGAYGVDYVAFTSTTSQAHVISFDGEEDVRFRLTCILMKRSDTSVVGIARVTLDSLNRGSLHAAAFGSGYDRIVMTVMCVDSSLDEDEFAPYVYSASPLTPGRWEAQTSGIESSLRSVAALSDRVVWAGGVDGVILRTTDGGGQWARVGEPIGGASVHNVEGVNSNTALVAAYSEETTTTSIYRTSNGGNSWASVYDHVGGFTNDITMFSHTEGIAVGDPVGRNWTCLRTTDAGNTWIPMAGAPEAVKGERGWSNGVTWINTTIGWFGTNASRAYRTTDGGTTWSPVSIPPVSLVSSIAFNQMGVGLAAGGEHLAKTTDGGDYWETIPPPGSGTMHHVVAQGDRFWLLQSNSLYTSIDGGTTWEVQTASAAVLRHLSFASTHSGIFGWLVGDNGALLRYEDTFPPPGMKGDVNGDGVVNIVDVVRVVNIILGDEATAYERWAADCNEDGHIDILDLVGIINVILDVGTCPS